ncbi:hypothetical protein LTR36_001304 [Oleoguttula mirabilis]|uniref:Uncharacterized protein n=1 Tax=Oleoguttula mirabilis TaxID=1507867 RepID=A0AAV9JNF8_9PEZI|nr:hypothetical protein LTR36_001304 [Oleoguttula mirabilis]
MVTVNIVQAFLIDQINNFAWITMFPLVVFLAMILGILINAVLSRKELLKGWSDAEGSARAAWIGIVLSILLPVVICEFFYLPFIAIRAWHTVEWKTSLEAHDHALFPAVIINNYRTEMNMSMNRCFRADGTDCKVSPMTSSQVGDVAGQYFTFNPVDQDNGSLTADADAIKHSDFSLSTCVKYNSSHGKLSGLPFTGIQIGLYDPYLPFHYADFFNWCGNPQFYFQMTVPITDGALVSVTADTFVLSDPVGALARSQGPLATALCSQDVLRLTNYTYYSARVETDTVGDNLVNSSCDLSSAAYTRPCAFNPVFFLSSSLVTTQTSSRGTNTLKVLIEESGIVGGILFFTWFLGIFVV